MHGKIIVFEGLDSSGKKTQTELLESRLKKEGRKVVTFHFPSYQKTRFGELISKYLKGEFGAKEEISPEIGSLLYALDRYQFKKEIEKALEEGAIVILDRYTPSNIYQAAKMEGEKRFELWEWIKSVESRLPKADIIIFLDVPPQITQKLFAGREVKNALVETGKDIHESDIKYQEKVRELYLEIGRREEWVLINCCTEKGGRLELRSPQEIHEEIFKKLKEKGVF